MGLRMVVNNRTGERRYFVGSRRVSREAYDAARSWRTVDTFYTVTLGNLTRHSCEAR